MAAAKPSEEKSKAPMLFKKTAKPLAIKLGGSKPAGSGFGCDPAPSASAPPPQPGKKKASVAAVFNQDSDSDDEEEMPMEAKMRMRNVGRETITSSGPNSFGKTKRGFTDSNKLFERKLNEAMEKAADE